ncbi:MAG: AAC(3) family N-acetyltransferase [Acidimicrobiales bacterium]
MESPRWTVEQLAEDIRRLGVTSGDLIMVHASLRSIGPVDGGADGVVDALEAAVGAGGTLLMTLGARDDFGWVNDRPESERPALLRDTEPFDCLVAPADPDNGVLAEVFRTRARTKVNDHPEGRMGASGRLADQLLDDAPWDNYYGADSVLHRFVDAGGRVLRLGADLDTLTVLHYAEYLVPLPTKRRVRRHRLVKGRKHPELRVVACLDDCDGIVDYPGGDYFPVILRDYLATDRATTGVVGRATSELIDAADVVDFGVAWMAEHLVSE